MSPEVINTLYRLFWGGLFAIMTPIIAMPIQWQCMMLNVFVSQEMIAEVKLLSFLPIKLQFVTK